ncbi:MAG TPA: hypothetical protein VGE97_03595, partial [Nitrososphaera sp.]
DGHGNWFKRDSGYICNSCYSTDRRLDLKSAAYLDSDHCLADLQKNILFDPNFKMPPPRRCARCGSSKTGKRSRKKGGGPDSTGMEINWTLYGSVLNVTGNRITLDSSKY